ncbi:uncharacterized protein [Spinacia oleracea]|uniref:Uncharacterized protein n=1 Tax=Spinacia oleracea TaxID=3562 RepID=A0A9R0K7H0_SPIOL|nr:uncharacterized protein LOC110799510 [Spinacia oleracea]
MEDIKSVEACFLTEGEFDHSPGLITVYPRHTGGRKPFRYFTMWKSSPDFAGIVQHQWNQQVHGSKMYSVVTRLKKVKQALRELNKKGFSDNQASDLKAYHAMIAAQEAMHLDPANQELADLELVAIENYRIQNQAYVDFLKQKAKIDWVCSIHGMDGVWRDTPDSVSAAFLEYYVDLVGKNQEHRAPAIRQVVREGPLVSEHHRTILSASYTIEEVKQALFSIPGVKAPGPDGFGCAK